MHINDFSTLLCSTVLPAFPCHQVGSCKWLTCLPCWGLQSTWGFSLQFHCMFLYSYLLHDPCIFRKVSINMQLRLLLCHDSWHYDKWTSHTDCSSCSLLCWLQILTPTFSAYLYNITHIVHFLHGQHLWGSQSLAMHSGLQPIYMHLQLRMCLGVVTWLAIHCLSSNFFISCVHMN